MNSIKIQEQLDRLYSEYLAKLYEEEEIWTMIENQKLSSPQLLDVTASKGRYAESENRLVFIGQETNGWYNKEEREEDGLEVIGKEWERYIEGAE